MGCGGKADTLQRGGDWAAEERRTRCREEVIGLRREGCRAGEERRTRCGGEADGLQKRRRGKGSQGNFDKKVKCFFTACALLHFLSYMY